MESPYEGFRFMVGLYPEYAKVDDFGYYEPKSRRRASRTDLLLGRYADASEDFNHAHQIRRASARALRKYQKDQAENAYKTEILGRYA